MATPTQNSYYAMRTRCTNPNSEKDYEGRIELCDRWNGPTGFANFLEDMGERPEGTTIDRKDNSKGYYKENCRWATKEVQERNKRTNRMVTHNGKTQCIVDWCAELGIKPHVMYYNLNSGKTIQEILDKPSVKHGWRNTK